MRRVEKRNMVQKPFTTHCSKNTHLGARPPKPLAFLSLVMSVAAGVTRLQPFWAGLCAFATATCHDCTFVSPKDGVQRPILKWNLLRHYPHKTNKNLNKTKTTSFLGCKLVCWPRVTFAFSKDATLTPRLCQSWPWAAAATWAAALSSVILWDIRNRPCKDEGYMTCRSVRAHLELKTHRDVYRLNTYT